MIKEKQNKIDFLGRLIFISLIYLLISVFSQISSQRDNYTVHHESVTYLHSINTNAVAINPVDVPSFQKDWVRVADKMHQDSSDQIHKIFADNKKIIQQFISLQKTQLKIKPKLTFEFYYHLFSPPAEDLPILG
jgi:hypothetical protein